MAVTGMLGLWATYAFLKEEHDRAVAAICTLLLGVSVYYFKFAVVVLNSDMPYLFASFAALFIGQKLLHPNAPPRQRALSAESGLAPARLAGRQGHCCSNRLWDRDGGSRSFGHSSTPVCRSCAVDQGAHPGIQHRDGAAAPDHPLCFGPRRVVGFPATSDAHRIMEAIRAGNVRFLVVITSATGMRLLPPETDRLEALQAAHGVLLRLVHSGSGFQVPDCRSDTGARARFGGIALRDPLTSP